MMIDALTLDRMLFSGTTRLMLDEMELRGWKAHTVVEGSSHLYVDRGDDRFIHFFGSTPPQQSYAAGMLSNNKPLTSLILQDINIPQLPFLRVDTSMSTEIDEFIRAHNKIVVKPIDGSHGNGIRANVMTLDDALSAISYAREFSNSSKVLIQKQFSTDDPCDIRILCMDGRFTAAIHRVPARVYGDGASSISKLIELENKSSRRGVAYKSVYATIDEPRARKFLGEDKIFSVPTEGEEVRVMDVANYGAGGELIDVTDSIPEWMRLEAEKASVACGVCVAGVDYLVSELPDTHTSRAEIDAVIIELNKSPSLMIHDNPHVGKNRRTVSKFVDIVAEY